MSISLPLPSIVSFELLGKMSSHHAHKFHTIDEYLQFRLTYVIDGVVKEEQDPERRAKIIRQVNRLWKKHVEKHGNVPLVIKCRICSGAEFKDDLKAGRYKRKRPRKSVRDEIKETKE